MLCFFVACQNQAEMEKFKGEEVEMASQRKALLKGLEDDLTSSSQYTYQYESQFKQTKKILEQLKSGSIIQKILSVEIKVKPIFSTILGFRIVRVST